MKIAVASDDGITITGHVGRCDMFLIFDISDNEIKNLELRKNSFTMHKAGGHNHSHSNTGEHEHTHNRHRESGHHGIVNGLNDCNYLLCTCAGQGLIVDLANHGIKTIMTDEVLAETGVKRFIEGTLINQPDKSCEGHQH